MRLKKIYREKKFPKISIITPVLNGEIRLEKCLRSVSSQNYPKKKIEHIIIDGGSKDNSINIIKKYKNKIKYWHSKKDKGIYDAMNIGLKKCSGEIIGILNSDDFYYKNTFQIIAKYFNTLKIDFLFGSVLKQKIFHNYYPEKLWYTFNIYPSHSVSFFIKKKAQKKIGNYNLKFKYSADRDLIYRMIKKHKIVGFATKRNEVFGKFNLYGFSSRVHFFTKVLEEIRIRLSNKQNFIQVFFVSIIYVVYYFLIKNFKKFN
jgi:glycosyltransferase involved in cell wall biosynthesis